MMEQMRFIATKLMLGSMVLLQAGCEYEPKMHMDIPGMHPLKIQLLGSMDSMPHGHGEPGERFGAGINFGLYACDWDCDQKQPASF